MSTLPVADGWSSPARLLYLVAMAVFLVTIGMGILNGADALELDRNEILTHVHSGTIGWITLTVVATAFVLFRASSRWLAVALAVTVPVYVLAFWTGSMGARAITGVALLAVVGWLLAWTWSTFLAGHRSLPGLAVVLGLTTFAYGAVVGTVLQVQFALGEAWLRGDSVGAHAAAMVFGYLVLASMGIIEWRLRATGGLPRAGVIQLGALFLGGAILSVGLLAGAGEQAAGVYLLTEVVAVVLFVVRVLPAAFRVDWMGATPDRYLGAAAIWVVVALAMFFYLIVQFLSAGGDVTAISPNLLIANDHAVFIGVTTNVAIGLLGLMVARGRGALEAIVFWGVNVGLIVFIAGLIADVPEIKRIGAPLMGVFLLVALAIHAGRLVAGRAGELSGADAVASI